MKNFFNREENMLHWGMGELLEQCSWITEGELSYWPSRAQEAQYQEAIN